MTTTHKAIIFFALTFLFSWTVVIGGWSLGFHLQPGMGLATLALSMFGPSFAALVCAFAFEKRRRGEALGLRFKPNWWWLLAWVIPILIAAAAVAITVLLSSHAYIDPGEATVQMVAAEAPEHLESVRAIPAYGAIIYAQALLLGALVNTLILTFSEELGWRGYLYDLWRKAGFWRYSLATGAIWGVWHAPMIYLFGHNYPDDRVLGLGLFVLFCLLLSPIMTLVRDCGGSVWAAGILHGTINALGGLSMLVLSMAPFPWNGMLGIGGYAALALGVALVFVLQRRAPAAT